MLTRESDGWDYVHVDEVESWAIIAKDSETGMYGYARLVRDDRTGDEQILGFTPYQTLTDGIKSWKFDLTTREWVD